MAWNFWTNNNCSFCQCEEQPRCPDLSQLFWLENFVCSCCAEEPTKNISSCFTCIGEPFENFNFEGVLFAWIDCVKKNILVSMHALAPNIKLAWLTIVSNCPNSISLHRCVWLNVGKIHFASVLVTLPPSHVFWRSLGRSKFTNVRKYLGLFL